MREIFRQLVVCALVYNVSGYFTLMSFTSQAHGWQLTTIRHVTVCCVFYLVTAKNHQRLWPILCALLTGLTLHNNWFSYYGQTSLQNILLGFIVYFSWHSYHTIDKFNYYARMLGGVLFFNNLTGYVVHTWFVLFANLKPHNNPLRSVLHQLTGISDIWLYITFGFLILVNAYHFYTYPKIAERDFNPDNAYILHFLPMTDGIRTWLIFLFSMLPIPHYAIYYEGNLWKFSKKEGGLVRHPIINGKLDKLFKWGLILICEPVQIINRLEPLEGKLRYSILTGDTCLKLAGYVKGELPFNDKWVKIARESK
jgi:hypothetical protein